MNTKKCSQCEAEKSHDEYYRNSECRGGLQPKCKECCKFNEKTRRLLNPEKFSAYEKERFARPERKSQMIEAQRRRREANPEKAKAHNAVSNAIRDGRLTRKPCEVCGEPKSQAHHLDYKHPLAVRWMCFKHHREIGHGQKVIATV